MLFELYKQLIEVISSAYPIQKKYYCSFRLRISKNLKQHIFAKYSSKENIIFLNTKNNYSHTAKCLSLLREVAKHILYVKYQAQGDDSITYGGPEFWIIYKKLINSAIRLDKFTAIDILSETNNIESITKIHTIARKAPKLIKLSRTKDKTYRFYCFSRDINNKELLKQEGFIWNPFINSWFTKEFYKEKNVSKLRTYGYNKNRFILLEL